MQIPLQIGFHGMEPSVAIEEEIRQRAEKLDEIYARIISIRVVVEEKQHPRAGGKRFHIRLEITIPGEDVIVNRDPGDDDNHKNIHAAIRDAFSAARRQLLDRMGKMQGKVKSHEGPPHAFVARIFKDDGYGFLETPDGREIFFHENSVLNGQFNALEVGTEVRFAEEAGEKGPQASTVDIVGIENKLPYRKAS
jgi:cold shock CspA family protein/ribosome-associated translation inhibitor RaiA